MGNLRDQLKNRERRSTAGATLGQFGQLFVTSDNDDQGENAVALPSYAQVDDNGIVIGAYRLTALGLERIEGVDVSQDDFDQIGKVLFALEDRIQLLIGDWLDEADTIWGYSYDQIADEVGYKPKTLRNWRYVAAATKGMRYAELTFKHYRLVASLNEPERRQWLEAAAREGYSPATLNRQLTASEGEDTTAIDLVVQAFENERKKIERVIRSRRPDRDERNRIMEVIAAQIAALQSLKDQLQ